MPSSNTVVGRRLRTPSSDAVVEHRRRTPSLNTDDTHLVAPAPPPLTPREFPAPSATSASPPCTHAFTPRESRVESRESRVSSIAKRGRARLTGRAAGPQRERSDLPTLHPLSTDIDHIADRRGDAKGRTTEDGRMTCHHPDDVSPPRRRVTTPTTTPGSGKSKRTIVDENQRALRARPPM